MSDRTPMSPDALSRALPNAYKTSPRMGGYLRTMVSPNNAVQSSINPAGVPDSSLRPRNSENVSQEAKAGLPLQGSDSQTPSKTPRQPGQSGALALAWDGSGADDTPGFIGALTPENCFVLSMTVSTVMALAAGAKVPDSHLSSTSAYLATIKNGDDELPINIKGIKKVVDQANPTKSN